MTGLETQLHRRPTSGATFAGAYNPNGALRREERLEHLLELPSLDSVRTSCTRAYFGQMKEIIDWLEGHGIVFADSIAIGAGPKIWHVYDKGNDASPGGHFMQCFGAEAEQSGHRGPLQHLRPPSSSWRTARWPVFWPRTRRATSSRWKLPSSCIGTGGYANNS